MRHFGIQLIERNQMASVLSSLIVSACVGMSSPAKEACQKAVEAAGKQSGIEKQAMDAQKKLEKTAKREATELMGKTPVDVIGGTVFLVKAISDKSVGASVPTMGLADKIRIEVGEERSQIKMEWKFD